LCKSLVAFSALLISSILLVLLSRIPLKIVLRSMRPILFVIFLTSVFNLFGTKGENLLTPEGWWISIYEEGIWNAVFMILRISVLIIGTGLFLTYTTTPIALTDALEQLLSPLKVFKLPVHDFAMIMTIALRFIPTFSAETERIMNAQKARGADLDTGSLLQRVKALVPVLIPLFISSFRRADELAMAMECRCYHGGDGRTRMKQLHITSGDVISTLVFCGMVAVVIATRWLPF
jgi:energy-coupling factor transport system permease protein